MELINRQDAIKALRDTFLGDTYEIDVVACGMIECLKPVEAIPIDFIKKKIDEYREKEEKTKDVPLYGSFQWLKVNERLTLESLLLEWYAEPEEQNETD